MKNSCPCCEYIANLILVLDLTNLIHEYTFEYFESDISNWLDNEATISINNNTVDFGYSNETIVFTDFENLPEDVMECDPQDVATIMSKGLLDYLIPEWFCPDLHRLGDRLKVEVLPRCCH